MDEAQKDFLSEILNIGLGRAGAVLSQMSGARVNMTVPNLVVCKASDLPQHLTMFGSDQVLTVTQSFSGILTGEVVMVLSAFSGQVMTYRLFGGTISKEELESEMESAITEVGNIVINHFVGSWSQIFCDQFRFGVPAFQRTDMEALVADKVVASRAGGHELQAIFAEAHLDIPDFFVMTSLVTLFQQSSLERLVGSLSSAKPA